MTHLSWFKKKNKYKKGKIKLYFNLVAENKGGHIYKILTLASLLKFLFFSSIIELNNFLKNAASMRRSWLLNGTAFLGDLKLIDVLFDNPFLTDITHTSQIVPRRPMIQTLAPLKFQTYILNCFSECKRHVSLTQQT